MTLYKRILIAALLFFAPVFVLKAQTIQIKWSSPVTVQDTLFKTARTVFFDGARIEKDLLPHYVLKLHNAWAENFTLINTRYEQLSPEESTLLRNREIPTKPVIQYGVQNKKPVSIISFVPLRLNGQTGLYEKLVSFGYQYENKPFSLPANPVSRPARTTRSRTARIMATNASVLSGGQWYKLAINKTGMFKIDFAFLKSIGINPGQIDPHTIQIFGNPGGMLPQPNSTPRPDDLLENAIFVSGESDNSFDNGDYILFYGSGPDNWTYNTTENVFNHSKHLYSNNNYVFLTYGSTNGLRVQDLADLGAGTPVTYFDEHKFVENDDVNILNSGREWYGNVFDANTTNTFSFNFPGLINGSPVKITSSVMSRSVSTTGFTLTMNGTPVPGGNHSLSANSMSTYDPKGAQSRLNFTATAGSGSTIDITYTYNKGTSVSSVGYLNYLAVNVRRTIALYGNETDFRTWASQSAATTTYTVGNADADVKIWDVTDCSNIKNQLYVLNVPASTATFSAVSNDTLHEYVVFTGTNFPEPVFVGTVDGQNVHGVGALGVPDLVIVTHPDFINDANRLANFRTNNDGLEVAVVTTAQIYNEFSSGVEDITAIRDFVKMVYDRGTAADSLRYLLLFGDCSYDYKNRVGDNTNYVPVYESRESLDPLRSYSSDDYFGFLDNTEGAWVESGGDASLLDIGIGRLPARNTADASAMVDKLIHYSSSQSTLGKWRNKVTFVADDGDGNLHLDDAQDLSTKVDTSYETYNVSKIFLDAFHQDPTPGGEKAPEVVQKINDAVENGTLILNYSGHGGEEVWAQETILDIPQVESWTNNNKLPFMITATCDFGRYDDPGRQSGAEVSLTRDNGGTIGLITSTRVVYQFSNRELNLEIYNFIFKPMPNGEMPRLGDVHRNTKNESVSGVNNRNYALLGDPSLRLAYPSQNAVVTKIKGVAVTASADTLKALSKVTLEGEIRNSLGVINPGFSGTLNITIYDKKSIITTFGTQGGPPVSFDLRNNIIFDGTATVAAGVWSVSFVVPKDISYQYDFGKISIYAKKEGTTTDAAGYYTNIIIGGTDPTAPADNTPPRIKLYMNDDSFVSGGLTGKDAMLLAKLTDENGINTAGSGIGHEITTMIDNNDKTIILNEFYTAKLDDYTNGTVKYPFKDLTTGYHSLKFKAWDTYNNSSEATLDFIVASDEKIALSHILNYPNPFSTHTVFHFDHNRPGDDIDVMIQIYTISGKLIKTLDTKVLMSGSHFSGLDWDGRDDFGDRIGKGVYVYRVWIRTPRDGSAVHKYEKLVILN